MLFDSANLLAVVAFSSYTTHTAAQKLGQIGDGQVQAPTSALAPAAAPKVESPSAAPYLPSNHTNHTAPMEAPKEMPAHGMALPSAKAPMYTANSSLPVQAVPTGGMISNGSAPVAPVAPSIGGAAGGGAEASPTESEAPKEAGTSTESAVAATGGAGRIVGRTLAWAEVAMGIGLVGGMW